MKKKYNAKIALKEGSADKVDGEFCEICLDFVKGAVPRRIDSDDVFLCSAECERYYFGDIGD